MATRRFLVSLELELVAATPDEAAREFVRRVRDEPRAIQVDVLEDRGEDSWSRLGRRVVELADMSVHQPSG